MHCMRCAGCRNVGGLRKTDRRRVPIMKRPTSVLDDDGALLPSPQAAPAIHHVLLSSLSSPSPPSPPLLFPLTCIHHSSPLCYLSDLLVMFRLRPLASRNSTFVSRTTSCARRHPLERSPSHVNRRYLTDEPHPRTPPLRHQNTPADLLSPKKQAEAVSGELPSTPAGPSTGYGGFGSGGAGGVRDAVLTTVFGVVVCEFASLRVNRSCIRRVPMRPTRVQLLYPRYHLAVFWLRCPLVEC